jgi:two-component system sensor histidine kinase ChiS
MDTSVISDTVNVASRLESITKEFGSEIIVSQTLLNGLPDSFQRTAYLIRPLGRVTVKGKRQPVSVCEVYDCNTEDQKAWKQASAERFASGIERYFAQDFTAAYKLFWALSQENPFDQACQYYARMSRKLGGC